jgi:hypothetical protein
MGGFYTKDGRRLLSLKEYSELHGCSHGSLRNRVRAGLIPEAIMYNRMWYIPEDVPHHDLREKTGKYKYRRRRWPNRSDYITVATYVDGDETLQVRYIKSKREIVNNRGDLLADVGVKASDVLDTVLGLELNRLRIRKNAKELLEAVDNM